MGLLGSLPSLENNALHTIWEYSVKPLMFVALMVQGTTAIVIDEHLNIHFKKATKVRDPELGVIVDGEFIPADGQGSFYTKWNTTVVVHIEDLDALLNPATTTIDEADVAAVERDPDTEIVIHGSSRSLRELLAAPFWMFFIVFLGTCSIYIDENRNLDIKKAKKVDEPDTGLVVSDEFKRADGHGCLFQRWNTRIGLAIEGLEALWNPSTAEILRAKEEVEMETDESIGAGSREKEGVVARERTLVNAGRISDYQPFAMLDGSQSRKQMMIAYEAHSKKSDRSAVFVYGGMVMSFFMGAISPRLNGSGGGGGGGVGLPVPTIAPLDVVDPTIIDAGISLAVAGVV